jgi:putative membrane protein insertion efficiency factor
MIRGALIALVRLYQFVVSPMLPRSCRFFPSCSQYMIDAITIHGPFRGVWMGVKRILRCQPLCKGGFDFVKVEEAATSPRR